MGRRITTILLSFLMVMSFNLLTGCDVAKTEPPAPSLKTSVCIVLGKTNNTCDPDLSILQDRNGCFFEAARWEGKYSVIIADGNPQEIKSLYEIMDIENGQFKKRTSNTISFRDTNSIKDIKKISNSLRKIEPLADEVDIISALDLAIRTVSEDKDTHTCKILVFSSGLATKGDLNFLEMPEAILKDPQQISSVLYKNNSLHDLTGIEIDWYGIGDVSGDQSKLSSLNRFRLQEIWSAILIKFGGTVNFKTKSLSPPTKSYSPKVTPVILPEELIVTSDPWVFLDEQIGGFDPGYATFIDRNCAINAVRDKAELIIKDENQHKILIVGTTANWPPELDEDVRQTKCVELSLERADAVKQLFHDAYYIPLERFETLGMGFINPWYKYDQDGKGGLDEAIAPSNRSFALVDADSELAQALRCGNIELAKTLLSKI